MRCWPRPSAGFAQVDTPGPGLAVVAGNARVRAFYERAGWRDEGPFDYGAAGDNGTIALPCRRYTKQV